MQGKLVKLSLSDLVARSHSALLWQRRNGVVYESFCATIMAIFNLFELTTR